MKVAKDRDFRDFLRKVAVMSYFLRFSSPFPLVSGLQNTFHTFGEVLVIV